MTASECFDLCDAENRKESVSRTSSQCCELIVFENDVITLKDTSVTDSSGNPVYIDDYTKEYWSNCNLYE